MPNWAFTDYVIEGPHESIANIYEAIKHPDTSEGDEGWEGGVLKALDIEWESRRPDGSGLYMRGFIQEEPSIHDSTLEFYAKEAWGATDFNEALEGVFPDIKVYYKTEEEGEEVYATNDKEGKYFPDRFYVDVCIDGDYQSEYFIYKSEMFKWLYEITDGRVNTQEKLDEFNSDYEDSGCDDENYIHVYEFAVID